MTPDAVDRRDRRTGQPEEGAQGHKTVELVALIQALAVAAAKGAPTACKVRGSLSLAAPALRTAGRQFC